MIQQRYKNKKAFTLIETLLYISLASIMLMAISAFMGSLMTTKARNEVINEVDQQSTQVLQIITESIQAANSINTPILGSNGNSLSLQMANATVNPTLYTVSSGVLRIQEGASSPINLTSNKVTISNLNFYNMSVNADNQAVRFSFTITYNNTNGRSEYNFSKTYYGSATIK